MTLVKYLTPTNLAAEKERFFSSSTYHPQLTYEWETPVAKQWVESNPQYAALTNAMTEQDTIDIVKQAQYVFSTQITPEFLSYAHSITTTAPQKIPQPAIDTIVAAFTEGFEELGLTEYSLEVIDQQGFNFRPSAQEKKIIMSQHLNLDFFSVDGEIKHELLHIIRHENTIFNSIPVADNYLPTEEGLATYCQDYTGENGVASLFQHAAEYTMTEVALEHSLRDVIEYLQEIGFSAELAWQRAIRHKYGFHDTSQPGDIMKPSMYFYHQQLVKQLTTEEKYRLLVGKIRRNQLQDFPTYTGRIPLKTLEKFYSFSQ